MQYRLQEEVPHDPSQIHKNNKTFHVPRVNQVDLQDQLVFEEGFYASFLFESLMYRGMERKERVVAGDWEEVQVQWWIGNVSRVMFVYILVILMKNE
jgi:hypothetical protein